MAHKPKRPPKLTKKAVEKILKSFDWPAYHNRVIEGIMDDHRCRCADCMMLPKHQRYVL